MYMYIMYEVLHVETSSSLSQEKDMSNDEVEIRW